MTQRPALTHQRLEAVRAKIATLNDAAFHLHVTSADEDVDLVADTAYAVYDMLRDLSRPKPVTGCEIHPRGALDPLAPDGWGRCLLCNSNRRRGRSVVLPQVERVCAECHRPYLPSMSPPRDGLCSGCR